MVKDPLLFLILDPQVTESTSTTKAFPSFLMSFQGDLVPYFHTTASEEEIVDKTVGDSAATLLDGDGGEIEPRETAVWVKVAQVYFLKMGSGIKIGPPPSLLCHTE